MDSILTSIKKLLGIAEEYKHFDPDLIMHINSVLSILNQIGVGPAGGFSIQDESVVWADFIQDNPLLELVKSYVHFKVKLLFDPPLSSAVTESMNKMIGEFEWRMLIATDSAQIGSKEEFQNGE